MLNKHSRFWQARRRVTHPTTWIMKTPSPSAIMNHTPPAHHSIIPSHWNRTIYQSPTYSKSPRWSCGINIDCISPALLQTTNILIPACPCLRPPIRTLCIIHRRYPSQSRNVEYLLDSPYPSLLLSQPPQDRMSYAVCSRSVYIQLPFIIVCSRIQVHATLRPAPSVVYTLVIFRPLSPPFTPCSVSSSHFSLLFATHAQTDSSSRTYYLC